MSTHSSHSGLFQKPSRRKFIAGLSATAATIGSLPLSSAEVEGSGKIKVGIVGTGGRGTGAILQTLRANPQAQLVAAGDLFEDNFYGKGPRQSGGLPRIRKLLEERQMSAQIDLPKEREFTGFDSYQKVIECCDLVLLTTTPAFRPLHFEAAIAAGKHVFMEKPVCIDARGYNRVLRGAEEADKKGLKVVVGLQRHYSQLYLQAFDKVHSEGLIGDVIGGQCYWNGTRPWNVARNPNWSELEFQTYNWYHFNYLCGDHICEQHVHNIDVVNWFLSGDGKMGTHPVTAQGMGGRTGWESAKKSSIFDHHFVEFTYESGKMLNSQCRQQPGCENRVGEEIHGSKGVLIFGENQGVIKDYNGKTLWRYRPPRDQANNPFQQEHNRLHHAIINNEPLNNAYYGAHSSFAAVIGRVATYTGQKISWKEAVESDFSLIPDDLSWESEPPIKPDANGNYPHPLPGKTPLPWA